MKKCPYCAEDIQDAAIVCRYCGRDLPQTREQENKTKTRLSDTKKEIKAATLTPIWKQSAIVTLVLTTLYGIGAIMNAPDQATLTFWLTVRLIEVYIIWFLIVAALIGLWRKFGIKFIGIALFSLLIITIYVLSRNNASLPPSATSISTHISTHPKATLILNTPAPASLVATPTFSLQEFFNPEITYFDNECIRWQEVYPDYFGLRVCVYGVVEDSEFESNQTRIYFSNNKQDFYLFDPNYEYLILPVGVCVKAFGEIETDINNIPYIELHGQLWEC